jgi:hypothetical protein
MATVTIPKILANFETSLNAKISTAATTLTLNTSVDDDGTTLSGTYSLTIDEGTTSEEHMIVTLAGSSGTITRRGLSRTDAWTEVSGNKIEHNRGASVKITNVSAVNIQRLLAGTDTFNAVDWSGVNSISGLATPSSTETTKAANVGMVNDAIAAGGVDSSTVAKGIGKSSYAHNKSLGTATITIASPAVVSFTAHGLIAGDTVLFTTDGTLPTGITASTNYYVISTGLTTDAFQIATTSGGTAINTSGSQSGTHTLYRMTPFFVSDVDPRVPTQSENDALVGTSGTPSSSNKYVTSDDVSSSAASGKIVRASGTSLPALDGANLTGVAVTRQSYTASGSIAQNDSVYVSSSNTVKSFYCTAQGTGASVATAPTSNTANRSLPLSTNGSYLQISGGDISTARALNAQVRVINAAETDFNNGTEQAIYNTSSGVRGFDACSIGTDKFLFIYQKDTAGAAAGIAVKVATVSGTTVTVGSEQSIETTGNLSYIASCAKLDTDKAVIVYQKDSDGDFYAQVLTVSGTTVSTNTAVLIKAISGNGNVSATQLETDSAAIIYSSTGDGTKLYGRIISVSGTVPTINSENTLVTTGSGTWTMGLKAISSTKLLAVYACSGTPLNDTAANISISGATMTLSSTVTLGSSRVSQYYGISIIGTKQALVNKFSSNVQIQLYLLDISGTAPTSLSSQNISCSTTSGLNNATAVVKVSPWTYVVTSGGSANDGDAIVKLTPPTTRIGIAESAISDTASGVILMRYATESNHSGLTSGSLYYVDDTAQPTTSSSLTSPTLGAAISATKMLLQ